MSAPKTLYRCAECGHSTPKWLGRCPSCGKWNSMAEEIVRHTQGSNQPGRQAVEAISIRDIPFDSASRITTSIGELDRVLGGGLVEGAAVLVGGDPGIGKSTLMLQAAHNIAMKGIRVLYVTGEESLQQTRLRAHRLSAEAPELFVIAETDLALIHREVDRINPGVIIIDSIQTISDDAVEGSAGTISQVREVTASLVRLAKCSGIAVFLVGHVTKTGAIAGPRIIEHQVDTVLYFEGENSGAFRILRAIKNRFGSTNEIGVFEMRAEGLIEVANPSELFMGHRGRAMPGTAVVPCIEGTRPILVEVQALVGSSVYGTPQRAAMGIDRGRMAILAAVLERRAGLALADRDIFLNITGGLRITEPAADLALAVAIASALRDIPADPTAIFFGEVGLTGEIRAVASPEIRLTEGAKLGFKKCIMPRVNARKLTCEPGIETIGVETIDEALEAAWGRK